MLHFIPHLFVKNYLSCHSRKPRTSLPAYGRAEVYLPSAAPEATRGDQGRNDKQSPNILRLTGLTKDDYYCNIYLIRIILLTCF
jgi:hypothetical protein